ncbi:hypothetical protein CR970_02675 [Candidatus Saccharibacteria bacterium]|nr:MAG: hypothetical protein CR970_02675 [Candidatus Saccharibacteria bacterium]
MQANTTGYLLQHVAAIVDRHADQVLQERMGIGMAQYRVMLVLRASPGTLQKQVAEALRQTEASISRQVKLLVADGLVTSRVSQANRRQHLTALTPRGLRYIDEADRVIAGIYADALSPLSGRQLNHLDDILNVVHTRLCPEQLMADHIRFG